MTGTWQIEPLGGWPHPVTANRKGTGRFRASWDETLRLLIAEAVELGLRGAIAVRVDVDEFALRRDGMLRARGPRRLPGRDRLVHLEVRAGVVRQRRLRGDLQRRPDVGGDPALYRRLDLARRLLDPKEVHRGR